GATLAPVPYLGAVLATDLLRHAGAEATWPEAIAAGRERCGLLLSGDLVGLAGVAEVAGAVGWEVDGATAVLALEPSPVGPRPVRVALDERWRRGVSSDLTRPLVHPPAGAPVRWAAVGGPLGADA